MLKAPGLSCSVRKISNKLLFANNDLLIKPYELPGNSHYYIAELSLTFRVCNIFSHIFSLSHYYMNTPIYALFCILMAVENNTIIHVLFLSYICSHKDCGDRSESVILGRNRTIVN